ncbi:MAG: CcmD family protein [Rhodothermales bacterium]
MTIHPIFQEAPQEAGQADDAIHTAYDSTWAIQQIPERGPVGSERFMLAEDKLFVVLAVVLIIWAGISLFLIRSDRKLTRLEKALKERS